MYNFSNILQNCGGITSGFGPRESIPGLPNASHNHPGVDISASAGSEVYSPSNINGAITTVVQKLSPVTNGGYGVVLKTKWPDGTVVYTKYYDMGDQPSPTFAQQIGQVVPANTVIGYVGNAIPGVSSGPHLHYQEMIALPGGDYSTAIAVDPQKNYFSLSAGTQTPCTVTTGTGISADNPVLNCGNVPEPYVSLLDKTTGTTTLFYTNLGVTFTATLQGVQQWQKTNSDGSTTIYTRNTIDAALGAFTPWEKQQSTNGDLFQTVGVVNTAIQNLFIVPGTTTKNPMLDSTGSSPTTLSTAELLALADATGGPVPSSLQSSQSATVQNGSSQTFTIYASGSNTVDQTIKLTLAQGDPTNKFVCTGAKEIAFDSSGNATVTIPAGQDHVTLTLVDGSNTSSADQLSLTASIVDPNAPAGSTPVSSNTFTVNFASPNPFAGTGSTTPVTPDRTIVGDFKPAEFQTELPAGTNPDLAALKWGSILKRVDGQTKTVTYTDSYGNTITNTVALTYVYTHTKKLKGSASHLISHNHATPPTH